MPGLSPNVVFCQNKKKIDLDFEVRHCLKYMFKLYKLSTNILLFDFCNQKLVSFTNPSQRYFIL